MIPIRQVHELVVETSLSEDRPGHIAAASSLVRHRGLLLIVADDELSLAIFDEEELGEGELIPILTGHLPDDPERRAKEKPDLESLALLPPFGEFSHGTLLAVGSGSADGRTRGALVPLARDGHPVDEPREVDLGELYRGLANDVSDLNIEGCAASGDRLYLAHRGDAEGAQDALIALDWVGLAECLDEGRAPTHDLVIDVQMYELGRLHGVDLSFSDLSPLDDGRLVFSSSAEDTSGAASDGEIIGSALGVLRPGDGIEYQQPVDGVVKIEGIAAHTGEDGIEVLIVMDADDPSKPSPLLGATII